MGNLGIGFEFALIGMSTVFSFLITLVVAINVMKVIAGFLDRRVSVVSASAAGDGEEEIAAVIAVACAKNKGV